VAARNVAGPDDADDERLRLALDRLRDRLRHGPIPHQLRFDEAGSKKADPAMEKLLKAVKAETLLHLHDVPKDADPKYAMGWMVAERGWADGRVLTHSGSNTMWYVVAWLAPKKDFAVITGTNMGGDAAAKACDDAAAALIKAHQGK